MSTKTRMTVPAAFAAGLLGLTGCSGGDPAAADGEIGGEVAYSFWGSPARADKVSEVESLFQEQYPDVSIEQEVADYFAYIERLTVRAAGNDLACATATQTSYLSQYAGGVLRPLDDLISSGQIDTSGIPADVIEAGKVDGEQYMIPTGSFVRVIGYNEDYVADSGAGEPGMDMTWEDYADWLLEIQAGLPEGVYASENEGGIYFTLQSWIVSHGMQVFEDGELGFGADTVAEYFQYWLDLQEAGATVPAERIPDQNGALELTPIATGDAAVATRDIPHLYIMERTLEGAGLPSDMGWFSMPSQSPEQSGNVLGANGISIPDNCDNVGTTAAWIDFFANDPDAAIAFQSDNGIVTNTEAQEALLADADTPEGVKQNVTILRELTDAGDLTTTVNPPGTITITNELLRLYQEAAFGQMSVDAAAQAFIESAQTATS